MKIKHPIEAEKIFARAVKLEKKWEQRNAIFCLGTTIYIFNDDKTVILKFKSTREFKSEIRFYASDYDTDEFEMRGDRIVFLARSGQFKREKFCRVPDSKFEDVENISNKFWKSDLLNKTTMIIEKSDLGLFDEGLSHIEFVCKNLEPTIIQRDIYAGRVRKITPKKMGLVLHKDNVTYDFGPLGMRTEDFFTLFSFEDMIKIHLLPSKKKYFIIEGEFHGMMGIVVGCLYDELGTIAKFNDEGEVEDYGCGGQGDKNKSLAKMEKVKELMKTLKKRQEKSLKSVGASAENVFRH